MSWLHWHKILSQSHALINHFRWVKVNIISQTSREEIERKFLVQKWLLSLSFSFSSSSFTPSPILSATFTQEKPQAVMTAVLEQFPSIEFNLTRTISRGLDCILGDSQMCRVYKTYWICSHNRVQWVRQSLQLFFILFCLMFKGKHRTKSNIGHWGLWEFRLGSTCSNAGKSQQIGLVYNLIYFRSGYL